MLKTKNEKRGVAQVEYGTKLMYMWKTLGWGKAASYQ